MERGGVESRVRFRFRLLFVVCACIHTDTHIHIAAHVNMHTYRHIYTHNAHTRASTRGTCWGHRAGVRPHGARHPSAYWPLLFAAVYREGTRVGERARAWGGEDKRTSKQR